MTWSENIQGLNIPSSDSNNVEYSDQHKFIGAIKEFQLRQQKWY
jgi:hypothetical protein